MRWHEVRCWIPRRVEGVWCWLRKVSVREIRGKAGERGVLIFAIPDE